MKAFFAYPEKERVLAEGETKSAILLRNGLQVDLRVVPPDSFGPALSYFTGSKEHNTQLRGIAANQGLKLNEYGLYKGEIASPRPPRKRCMPSWAFLTYRRSFEGDSGRLNGRRQGRFPTSSGSMT